MLCFAPLAQARDALLAAEPELVIKAVRVVHVPNHPVEVSDPEQMEALDKLIDALEDEVRPGVAAVVHRADIVAVLILFSAVAALDGRRRGGALCSLCFSG